MFDFNNKKSIPPPPPSPFGAGKKPAGGGAIPPPLFGKKLPAPGRDIKKTVAVTEEITAMESRLAREREELFNRLKEKENENLILQESFLAREKEETLKRQNELVDLKKRLEVEYTSRKSELEKERESFREIIKEVKGESKKEVASRMAQAQIHQQAFQEAQKQTYKDIEKLKKELEEAKRVAYEESIKHKEEEKNTIKVEQALKELLQGASRNQKIEETEREKEELREQLSEFEKELIQQKVRFSQKLQESESLREHLSLDYQSRLKESHLQYESKIFRIQEEKSHLNDQLVKFQYTHEGRKDIWETRLRDKIAENEKLVLGFEKKISEIKSDHIQKLSKLQQERDFARKDFQDSTAKWTEEKISLTNKITALKKEKDLIEKETGAKFLRLSESFKEKQQEFKFEKQLMDEKMRQIRSSYQEQENRWKEKINDSEIKYKNEIESIRNEYQKRISTYESEIKDLKTYKQDVDFEYRKLKKEFSDLLREKEKYHEQWAVDYEDKKKLLEQAHLEAENDYIKENERLREESVRQNEKIKALLAKREKIESETQEKINLLTDKYNEIKLRNKKIETNFKEQYLEIDGLNASLNNLNKRNSYLEDRLFKSNDEKTEEIYDFQKEIQKVLKEKNQKIAGIEDNFSRQLEIRDQQIRRHQQILRELSRQKESQIESIQEEFNNYRKNNQWLKEEWQRQREEILDSFSKKENKYNSEISNLKLHLEELEKHRLSEAEKFLRELELTKSDYRDKVDLFNDEISKLKEKFASEKQKSRQKLSLSEEEIVNLKDQLSEETNKYCVLKKEMNSEIVNLQNTLQVNEVNLKNVQEESDMWAAKYNQQVEDNKIIKIELEKREGDLKREIDLLKVNYEELLKKVEVRWGLRERGVRDIDKVREEIENLRESNLRAERELNLKDMELDELRGKFEEYSQSTTSYIKDMEGTVKEADILHRERSGSKEKLLLLEEQQSENRSQIDDLLAKLHQKDEKLQQIEAGLSTDRNESESRLLGELDEKSSRIINLESENKNINRQVEKLIGEIKEKDENVKNIKYNSDEKTATLRVELESGKKIINELNLNLDELNQKLSARDTINSVPSEIKEKDEKINQLKQNIDNLKLGMSELEKSAKKEYEDEIKRREKIITELKSELEETLKEIEKKERNTINNVTSDSNEIERLKTYNQKLKDNLQELQAQLDIGLDEVRKNSSKDTIDSVPAEKKWLEKWRLREKEIEQFAKKAKETTEVLKSKLKTAINDQKILSQLAEKENQEKGELARRQSELLSALDEAKKPFFRKILDRLKGTNKGIVLL